MWGTDYSGAYIDIYNELLGSERVERESMPYGDLLRSGAVVTYGADIPGVLIDEIAPLKQVEAAVTRQRPGFPNDRVFVERQRVTVEQALRAATLNGAYQLRLEDKVGSLEVGKRADLVVLDRNLFEIDPHEIHSTPVRMTLMDGRITFGA
jgi:predicted amidohydrolase YtcJ